MLRQSGPEAGKVDTGNVYQRGRLDGLRVLVVEDNFMLAELTRDLLEDAGCQVVGPVGRLEEGLAHARTEPIDGAILDINLHGELSFAIAEVLARRGVPFLFVTGYQDRSMMPLGLRSALRLDKPVSNERLIEAAIATFGHSEQGAEDPQDGMLPSPPHAAGERSVCAGEGAARDTGIRR